jgi:hypothetical protein
LTGVERQAEVRGNPRDDYKKNENQCEFDERLTFATMAEAV